ncbi:MAG: hypothetical protein R3C59_22060 [Planctomycetaceae bacterium]
MEICSASWMAGTLAIQEVLERFPEEPDSAGQGVDAPHPAAGHH